MILPYKIVPGIGLDGKRKTDNPIVLFPAYSLIVYEGTSKIQKIKDKLIRNFSNHLRNKITVNFKEL